MGGKKQRCRGGLRFNEEEGKREGKTEIQRPQGCMGVGCVCVCTLIRAGGEIRATGSVPMFGTGGKDK